jgi:hypothetical protein
MRENKGNFRFALLNSYVLAAVEKGVFRNKLHKLNICFLTRACTNQKSILKAREVSALCGEMFTTARWTTQRAESSSQLWARREQIVSSSVLKRSHLNRRLSGIVT